MNSFSLLQNLGQGFGNTAGISNPQILRQFARHPSRTRAHDHTGSVGGSSILRAPHAEIGQ